MRTTLLALSFLALAACDSEAPPLDHAEVRIANETAFDLDSARVSFKALTSTGTTQPGSEQVLVFGAIPSGDRTAYRPLDGRFVYTFVYPVAYGVYDLAGIGTSLCAICNPDGTAGTVSIGPGRYTLRLRLEPYEATFLDLRDAVPGQPDAAADRVEVRVVNEGALPFESVVVAFPSGADMGGGVEVDYGALEPGEASEYVPVPASYRYAPAKVVVQGDTAVFAITDFVGESLLGPGQYTFGLTAWRDTAYRDLTEIVREGDS